MRVAQWSHMFDTRVLCYFNIHVNATPLHCVVLTYYLNATCVFCDVLTQSVCITRVHINVTSVLCVILTRLHACSCCFNTSFRYNARVMCYFDIFVLTVYRLVDELLFSNSVWHAVITCACAWVKWNERTKNARYWHNNMRYVLRFLFRNVRTTRILPC